MQSEERTVALSGAQERLWFLLQLDGDTSRAHHLAFAVTWHETLDEAALRRALDQIVARHDVLRATFAAIDSVPMQRIEAADRGFALELHDLRDARDARAECARLTAAATGVPFDLERGPLVRGSLMRLADDEYVLAVTAHALIFDAASAGIFRSELQTLYDALRGDEGGAPKPELAPVAMQYADYATFQNDWIAGDSFREDAGYWKHTLAGAPAFLELPVDRPRPSRHDVGGDCVDLSFDAALTDGLNALARRYDATLCTALLTAWGCVLSRLSGVADVVVGMSTPNRAHPGTESTIGPFANDVALRLDFSGSPSVGEAIARTRARSVAAQAYAHVPFDRVIELLRPRRSNSQTPIFQITFAWHESASTLPAPTATAFDLTLELWVRDERIEGRIVYATALFDRETIVRYGEYFCGTLEGMVAGDERAIDRIALLSSAARRRIVEEWNATERSYPHDECVHELFERKSLRRPARSRWSSKELG